MNQLTERLGLGHPKITSAHLQRWACIYIRQSTARQVKHNQESQVNQYQLSERASALGWHQERIRIIDTDLGLSGQTSEGRSGFNELVAEVSLGHVGIIFGYEVSRLARNNSDWYHLLDLAAVFGTLIADTDGVYDPRLYNDRLLLGLKGTMSEAELHLLRLRLREGLLRKVERGELAQSLPTGLVRLADGQVVKDPDDQVRHTLELVFAKFTQLGSCRQVLYYLRHAEVRLPRRQTTGLQIGEIVWKTPSYAAVYEILTNPAYAGAFVYGRHQVDPSRRQPGRPDTGHVSKSLAEWLHIRHDVYPAYISWEQYLTNRSRLQDNATAFDHTCQPTRGAPRSGESLLQGLALCGVCGHHMYVTYSPTHRYVCTELTRSLGEPMCQSIHGPAIDEVVVQAFLAALQPAHLDALEALLAEQATEHARLTRQWEERLKRARYDAHLAERQYQAVDPDNRLVASELERRWEEKLRQVQEVQEGYARFVNTQVPASIPPELRAQFRNISASLPTLWQGDQLTVVQKKELLRSLISQVILRRTDHDTVAVTIVWVSGHYTVVHARPPIYRLRDADQYEAMQQQIHELWQQGLSDEAIATQLTAAGFRSARQPVVDPQTVLRVRLACGWKYVDYHFAQHLHIEGYLTTSELAERLGIGRTWVQRRIRNHTIAPGYVIHHPDHVHAYLLEDNPALLTQLKEELAPKRTADGGI